MLMSNEIFKAKCEFARNVNNKQPPSFHLPNLSKIYVCWFIGVAGEDSSGFVFQSNYN